MITFGTKIRLVFLEVITKLNLRDHFLETFEHTKEVSNKKGTFVTWGNQNHNKSLEHD